MAVNQQQIKELLGQGLSNEIVATAVGCTSSFISQLLSADEFAAEVALLRTKHLQEANKRDSSINRIEDGLIAKLQELVDGHMIHKPTDVLRAFAIVNNAKRRGIPAQDGVTVNNTVVTLTMPVHVVKQFTINHQGEVVDVEGQSMVTMPTHELLRSLSSIGKTPIENEEAKRITSSGIGEGINGKPLDKYERVSRYLPAAINSRKE